MKRAHPLESSEQFANSDRLGAIAIQQVRFFRHARDGASAEKRMNLRLAHIEQVHEFMHGEWRDLSALHDVHRVVVFAHRALTFMPSNDEQL